MEIKMKTIKIKRPDHIVKILEETINEFKAKGITVNLDQAHCLNDLQYWDGLMETKKLVDLMIKENLEIIIT
jgi:hypothetical protein